MSDDAEWGPWQEHDGQGMPDHARGRWCRAVWELLPGYFQVDEGMAGSGSGYGWDWKYWGMIHPETGFIIARIVRYQLRKPKGLTLLEQIAANPPQEPIGIPVPEQVPA